MCIFFSISFENNIFFYFSMKLFQHVLVEEAYDPCAQWTQEHILDVLRRL